MGTNSFISKVTPLGSATTYTLKDPRVQETIIGTQTAQTGSWTGKSNYINALYDGLTIKYYLPHSGSGNATLNLTLADNTTTGAISCYYSGNSRLTTHFGAGNLIILTYFSAGSISVNGTATTDARWYAQSQYDSNDVNVSRITYPRLKTGAVGIGRYGLFMQASDGTYQGITSTFNSTGTSHVKNSAKFRLDRVYYSNKSGDIAANTTVAENSWMDQQTSLIDLRYSTNCSTTLTANKPVYLVGTVGTDGLFSLADTWYTQTEPTTEDGKVYIYLGVVYPDTNPYRVAFEIQNSVYWYKNGGFRLYGSGRGIASISRSGTTFTATRDDGSTFTFTQQDNNSVTGVKGDSESSYRTGNVNITKANIGLSNVENTALSTWAGSSNITTIGTLSSGTVPWARLSNVPSASTSTAGIIQIGTGATNAAAGNHTHTTSIATDSGTNQITLAFGTKYKLTAGGTGYVFTMPSNPNTDTKVTQTNTTSDASEYRLLLSGSANDTTETTTARKNTNLRFNPSTNILSVGGSISTTGDLDITGNATISGETYADSLTAGSLLVNGATNFVQIPTAPTPATSSNDTSVATTAFVKNNLGGLTGAMHFKGTTTTAMSDGLTTAAVTIGGSSYTPSAGDVVLYNDGEYVWTGSAWELLGDSGSFKVKQTAVTTATAETTTATTFVHSVTQDANGVITVKTRPLPTYNNYSLPTASTTTKGGIKVGTGLTMSGETLNHSNTITAKTAAAQSAKTLTWGGTFTLYEEKYDAQGHVTGVASYNMTMPANPNTDTKNTAGSTDSASKLFLIGATAQSANPQTYSNSAVYAQAGAFAATSVKVAEKVTLQYNSITNALDFVFA